MLVWKCGGLRRPSVGDYSVARKRALPVLARSDLVRLHDAARGGGVLRDQPEATASKKIGTCRPPAAGRFTPPERSWRDVYAPEARIRAGAPQRLGRDGRWGSRGGGNGGARRIVTTFFRDLPPNRLSRLADPSPASRRSRDALVTIADGSSWQTGPGPLQPARGRRTSTWYVPTSSSPTPRRRLQRALREGAAP